MGVVIEDVGTVVYRVLVFGKEVKKRRAKWSTCV